MSGLKGKFRPLVLGQIQTAPDITDDPTIITQIERRLGTTQQQAVDEMIEVSHWSEHLPDYTGHRGSPAERLNALRTAYRAKREARP